MRKSFIIFSAVLLAGCTAPGPPDCDAVLEETFECLDRTGWQESSLPDCVALQESEVIEGTWTQDFELNLFHENERLPFEEAIKYVRPRTELYLGDSALEPFGDVIRVTWMRFEGRRPVCEPEASVFTIYVDRVLESELIDERPSIWMWYNP